MFRSVTKTDFKLVYSIFMQSEINRYMSFEQCTIDDFDVIFEHLSSRSQFLLYEENNEAVGILTVSRGLWRKNHVATIGAVAVPFLHQGKGVATRMFRQIIKDLRSEGIHRLELFVESDNPCAIGLYKKLGFEQEGLLRQYFKREPGSLAIDELIMAKIL